MADACDQELKYIFSAKYVDVDECLDDAFLSA